jgi:hypothetical protein
MVGKAYSYVRTYIHTYIHTHIHTSDCPPDKKQMVGTAGGTHLRRTVTGYVHMCICKYVCVYVCMYVYMQETDGWEGRWYTSTQDRDCVCVHVCVCRYLYVCAENVSICSYLCFFVFICMYVCMYVCMFTNNKQTVGHIYA